MHAETGPSPGGPAVTPAPRRLLDQVRERIRYKHYSIRTEQAYVMWIRRFIRFHDLRHPRDMGALDVEAFLSHLANERDVSSSTHNQAFSALLFLYGEVLGIKLPWLGELKRPKRPKRLPVILTREEVRLILRQIEGTPGLMAQLMYGTGMRLMECARLRIKDVDLARHEIVLRQGKGGKDRVTMVPPSLAEPLRQQIGRARVRWRRTSRSGARASSCRTRLHPSTGALAIHGHGSGFFRPRRCRAIRGRRSSGVTTCTRRRYSAHSSGRCARRG